MLYHRLFSLFGAVLIGVWAQTAAAASISLNPSSPTVAPNGTFTVDLFLNANDTDGDHPGNFSGQVRINYDPSLLTLVESSATLAELAGGSQGDMSFGFGNVIFNEDPDQGVVGTFTFQATAAFGPAGIGVEDAFGLMSFANNAGGVNEFFPGFSGTSVQVVPLPAASWLLLSALGALGLFGRKLRATPRVA
ncbi:MAG: cohesin domain-containing protein [Pseudomonadales bacterium]